MLKILQSWTQVEGRSSYYTDLCLVERMRIEGEEWVDRWRPPPPFALPLSPPPPSYLSRFAGISMAEGGARLISCPEFRTSGNLHPWVHINCCEEEGRRWRSCGEEGRSSEGVAAMELDGQREKERENAQNRPSFERHFSTLPRSSGFLFFRPPSLSVFSRRRNQPAGSKTLFNSGDRWSTVFIGALDFDSRGQFLSSPGDVERDGFFYTFIRSAEEARNRRRTGGDRLISWTGNVGWKDGEW